MKAVDKLIHDMQERPEDFSCNEHYLTDRKTDFRYWVASGFSFYGMAAPYKLTFSLLEKIKFHRALTRWKNAYAVHRSLRNRRSG